MLVIEMFFFQGLASILPWHICPGRAGLCPKMHASLEILSHLNVLSAVPLFG